MEIENRPEYLPNENMIVDIKYFDSSLLKIYKLSYKGTFSLNIQYIKYILTKSPNHFNDDKDYYYLFLDNVDGYIKKKTIELNI